MTKRQLQRLADLLLEYYEQESPSYLRSEVSLVRQSVLSLIEPA